MSNIRKISTCLISVYNKNGIDEIAKILHELNIKIVSTGGTKDYIEKLNIPVVSVESLTEYPSVFGGRVKTLHPKVFGGILARRDHDQDNKEMDQYKIPAIDLIIVDLYPFEETLKETDLESEIIEKIDIGGISLIRAAAKNYKDVLVVSDRNQYSHLINVLKKDKGQTDTKLRKSFAAKAFAVSSYYDTLIYNYFNKDEDDAVFRLGINDKKVLRYGENPHQKGVFWGNLDEVFDQLHGKELSYNNLLDVGAAVNLVSEFTESVFAVLKHNNPCGFACDNDLTEAWKKALAGDPVSAYGGILITNRKLDKTTAEEINKIFFEVIIAPEYDEKALEILKHKKNRIILIQKPIETANFQIRSMLNGYLWQDNDSMKETEDILKYVTDKKPEKQEIEDMLLANKVVKYCKSNAIVLFKDKMMLANGIGQTSRVDALRQAVAKANGFGFNLHGAVMASDAFLPFADSVEIAHNAGITAVIQPGGSIHDQDSVDYCNKHEMAMVYTGIRHFRH